MDGEITYEEYQHCLEAYDMCGENHFVGSGPGGKGYVKHEALAIERFVDILEERNMSAPDLFNTIDEDRSGQISLEELRKTIRQLKESIMEKDLQSIEKFFSLMDKDKNGTVGRQEFI